MLPVMAALIKLNRYRRSVLLLIPKCSIYLVMLLLVFLPAITRGADELFFQDQFKGKLGEGWSWVREHPGFWRVANEVLEIRIEPGNMWGPANNAKNVLLHPVPDPVTGEIDISVQVEHRPTEQY